MEQCFHFLLLALATWRLARLVTQESGPANVFGRLRAAVGTETAADGSLGELIGCKACASFWIGLAITLGYVVAETPTVIFCMALSLSAVTLLIERLIKQREETSVEEEYPSVPPEEFFQGNQ